MENFGQKLRALCKNNYVTQETLAEHLGITYRAVSKWENGQKNNHHRRIPMQNNDRIEKLKQLLKDIVPYFINFAFGIGVGLAVAVICAVPLRFIGINTNIGSFFVSFIAMITGLFLRSWRMGYSGNSRTYTFSLRKAIKLAALCFAVQAVLALLITPTVYIAGPTAWLETYLLNPHGVSGIYGVTVYGWLFMFLADGLVYGPLMVYGEYAGAKKHREDFCVQSKEDKL